MAEALLILKTCGEGGIALWIKTEKKFTLRKKISITILLGVIASMIFYGLSMYIVYESMIHYYPEDKMNYSIYSMISNLFLLISFLLFFLIVMTLINCKIRYLESIRKELELITEDDLQKPVTVKGNDEISYVAEAINRLKTALFENIEKERAAYQSNIDLVTSLSHDLRTPLTSQIGYQELALQDTDLKEETKKYMENALDKSIVLKNLTNQLFDHFLLVSEKEKFPMEQVKGNEFLMQFVEERLLDLEEKGGDISRYFGNCDCELMVNVGLMQRLFENLFSNLEKYADFQKKIQVKYDILNGILMIKILNDKKSRHFNTVSAGIGLKNCKSIMNVHQGYLKVQDEKENFSVEIGIPCTDKEHKEYCPQF